MMNSPSMFSVEQLLKARQDGVPDYVVVPMLQKAMAERQAVAQQQALQQGMNQPPPVAQQILGAAQNSVVQDHLARRAQEEQSEARGIDSLRSGIDESDYAGGGIVAFAEGGETDESDVDLPAIVNRHKNIFGQSKHDVPKDYPDVPANVADARRLIAEGYSHFDNPDDFVTKWRGRGASDLPTYKKNAREWLQGMGWKEGDKLNLKDPKDVNRMMSVIARQEMGAHVAPDKWDAVAAGKYKIRDGIPAASKSPQQGIASLPEAQSSIAYPQAPQDIEAPYSQQEEQPEYEAQQIRNILGEDPNAAAREARLSKREADIQSDKDRSPWLALMQAGLATMAGTSPNALTNIGAGAMEGLKSYGESRKDLSKSEEKLMDLRDEVEAAQRAEQKAIALKGYESAASKKAANRTEAKENELRKQEYGVKKAKFELEQQNIAGENEYRRGMVGAAQARADNTGGAGSKGAMTANQLVNTLKYQDAKYTKQIVALEKDDRLSDEEKQHEIDVRKDRQAKIADIMENIMIGNPIDHAEVLALNEPFPAYTPPPKKDNRYWFQKLGDTTPQPTAQTSNGGWSIRPR